MGLEEFMKPLSLVLIKPDAIERGLQDKLMLELLFHGYQIVQRRDIIVTQAKILAHYQEVMDRLANIPFSVYFVNEFVGKEIIALAVTHENPEFIEALRVFLGAPDPTVAAPHTIRARFGNDSFEQARKEGRIARNLMHVSDSEASARQELAIWFD